MRIVEKLSKTIAAKISKKQIRLEELDPAVIKSFSETIGKFQENHKRMMDDIAKAIKAHQLEVLRVPDSIKKLVEYGWYLPFDFNAPTINRYVQLLSNGKADFVDEDLMNYFDDKILKIEKKLRDRFPHRSAAIAAAFKAHLNKDYYLSIPVFFSQIEGICNEVIEERFFSVKKNKPKTTKWASKFELGSVLGLLVEPLNHLGAARIDQYKSRNLGINRHAVLHGDCNDYGEKKVNSYKTLSLLSFVAITIYEVNELQNKRTAKAP